MQEVLRATIGGKRVTLNLTEEGKLEVAITHDRGGNYVLVDVLGGNNGHSFDSNVTFESPIPLIGADHSFYRVDITLIEEGKAPVVTQLSLPAPPKQTPTE